MLSRVMTAFLQVLVLFIALTVNCFADSHTISLRLQWKHQFEFAGFYAAKELGYYRDAGLDVEILEYENDVDIISEVTSGDVDFGIWGSGIIERGMRNEPIVFLANYFKRSPLVLVTRPDITFPSELEGKTLMVSSADINNANYTQMFQTFNVDVHSINFVPPTFNMEDFKNGLVDGVSIFLTNEPYLLKKQGIPYNIIDPNNFGVELYDVNLFTSKSFSDSNPLDVENFIKASNQGWAYALDHQDEVVDLILEKYNSQRKSREHLIYEAQQVTRMIQPKSYPIGSIDLEQVNRIEHLFTEVGLTEKNHAASFVYKPLKPEITLTAEEQAYLSTRPEVRIAMMPDFTPFSFIHGGKPQGFENDLLALLSQKTGLRFKPNYGIWNQGLSAFKAGEVDMISSISYKEERTSFTLFTEPYYEIPIMIYVRDDFGNYDGLDSLKGRKVGILKDVFYAKELEKLDNMNLVVYETYDQLTKALVYGRIDALMQNLTNIDSLIKENAYTNLRLAGELQLPTIKKEDLRFGIRSDQPQLLSITQKGLDAISPEEFWALSNRWLGTKWNDVINAVSFNRPELEYLKQKGVIKMCVDPNWMPMEGIDDNSKHVGISAEILENLVKNTDLQLELVPTESWLESLSAVKARRCDILSLAMKTPQRQEYLNFTLPYLAYPFVIATQDHQQFINNLSLLNGKKLAMMKGYAPAELIANEYPDIKIVEVNSLLEGVRKVRSGETFGYVDILPALAFAIQREGLTDIYIAGKLDQPFELSVATRNDEPLLLNIMQKVLSSINPDAVQAINNKWQTVRFESRIDYSLLYKVIFGFVVLILCGLWRQRVIQKTKKIIEEKNQQLEKLAMTDMLTGLYNRHKVNEVLEEQLDLALRYNNSFAVMLLDIDHFKEVNDTYGHNVGDATLVEFSEILSVRTRKSDVVGRWGGEEFLIIVPQADKVDLVKMAESLRESIVTHTFSSVGKVTASIGLAIHRNDESISKLVYRVDSALYQSKQNGRNQVSVADLPEYLPLS